MSVSFFRQLYTPQDELTSWPILGGFPVLLRENIKYIQAAPIDSEIKEAIFAMGPLKSPGPDGLHLVFFHVHWDILSDSMCSLAKEVFRNLSQVRGVFETLLVHMPKVESPMLLKKFRPISLCNVVCKIVTKIVATQMRQLMSFLVSSNQCSFVPRRHSSNNVIAA